MTERAVAELKKVANPTFVLARKDMLQRKCACGGSPGVDGECAECRSKRLASPRNLIDAPTIQTKLTVNRPGDCYEQEADHMAERVMRMPEPISSPSKVLQRQAVENEEDEELHRQPMEDEADEEDAIQAKETPSQTPQVTPALQTRIDSLRGGGQPLPESTRAFMEPRFEYDFSKVRIHSDAQAAKSAQSVNALAFTVGRDVVFGEGQYTPETSEGRRLMVHELTHAVQQRDSSTVTIQRQGRGSTYQPQALGSLGVPGVTGHWEFFLSGGHVIAVPTPGASCADLADGTLCKGIPTQTNPIDVTSAFPEWVSQALAEQAASGIRFTQTGPEAEVGGYDAFEFDLGYGNCHGFSLQLFKLFANVPITEWHRAGTDPANPTVIASGSGPPPPGVPTRFGQFFPREQVINKLDNSDQEPVASANYLKTSGPGGYKWSAAISIGDRALIRHIKFVGGTRIGVPTFGTWGLWKNSKTDDHSVIALGLVGKDRVYVLQKMSPMNPYYINIKKIADYDWYRVLPKCGF